MPTCYRHPARETGISCQRCGNPICPDCMRDAAVGFHCPDCVRIGQKESRQGLAMYGGRRSADPRLTTFFLVSLNAIVWIAIMATGRNSSRLLHLVALAPRGRCESRVDPSMFYPNATAETCDLLTQGDGVWMRGFADGAWWQAITSAFTHVDIWHVGMNMIALLVLGPPLEQILGRTRFLAIYLLSALSGSLAVLWLSDPSSYTLGASGAIFGLLGALLVVFKKAQLDTSAITKNLLLGAVITVVGIQFISWQGHLGGFLGGAAAAAVVAHAPKANRSVIQWVGLASLAAIMLALAAVRAGALR